MRLYQSYLAAERAYENVDSEDSSCMDDGPKDAADGFDLALKHTRLKGRPELTLWALVQKNAYDYEYDAARISASNWDTLVGQLIILLKTC